MVVRRKIIAVLVGALAITAAGQADTVLASGVDAEARQPASFFSQPDIVYGGLSCLFDYSGPTILNSLCLGLLAEPDADDDTSADMQYLRSFTGGPGSFDLCLYALVGVGLCRSGLWLRRVSDGFIPDWYHDGGPYQVGHSRAISPDCLLAESVYCFAQPDDCDGDTRPLHHLGAAASLRRLSQCSPNVLASRGPPMAS